MKDDNVIDLTPIFEHQPVKKPTFKMAIDDYTRKINDDTKDVKIDFFLYIPLKEGREIDSFFRRTTNRGEKFIDAVQKLAEDIFTLD